MQPCLLLQLLHRVYHESNFALPNVQEKNFDLGSTDRRKEKELSLPSEMAGDSEKVSEAGREETARR